MQEYKNSLPPLDSVSGTEYAGKRESIHDVTPIGPGGDDLEPVSAVVSLPFGGCPTPTNLPLYRYNGTTWEPGYINDVATHICGETENFPIFARGFKTLERTVSAWSLPSTRGIVLRQSPQRQQQEGC